MRRAPTLYSPQLGVEGSHEQIRVRLLDGHRRADLQHVRGGPVDLDQDSGSAHSVRDLGRRAVASQALIASMRKLLIAVHTVARNRAPFVPHVEEVSRLQPAPKPSTERRSQRSTHDPRAAKSHVIGEKETARARENGPGKAALPLPRKTVSQVRRLMLNACRIADGCPFRAATTGNYVSS